MYKTLFIVAWVLCGLLLSYILYQQTKTSTPINSTLTNSSVIYTWRKNLEEKVFTADWLLVGSDGRIYADITLQDGIWHVWHNGAGYGDFIDEQAARRQAEKIAKKLGVYTR